jgi:competence ComEA-like helix-hairpin-helix protein
MTPQCRWIGAFLVLLMLAGAALPPPAAAPPPGDRVNINTATVDELVTLPGIGKAYAQRIVEYRDKNGPFKKVEDLLNVRGIGEKTFERIRDRITVGGK